MKPISTELLVVGGGVAGCCAAIASARRGVRTTLVERQGYFGGTGYAGKLQHICGLYLNGDALPEETLNNGLTSEIVAMLKNKAPRRTVQKIGQVYVLPYAADDLQEILAALIEAETNLTVFLNSCAAGVEVGRGNIRAVTVETPGETQIITATMVVDSTGNGEIAAMAGAEFALSSLTERQLAGFSIRVSGLGSDDTLSIKVPYYCAQGVAQNILPPELKFTAISSGESPDECFIKISLEGEDTPERDARAQENVQLLLEFLSRVLPAFRDVGIMDMSLRVLDREGRRITGDYMLTEQDVLAARKFPDAIVKNAWPVELWDRTKGALYSYVPRGDYYEIPFRCITVKGILNLLTAGRCISVSPSALGSTRVMGTGMALGEQAGLAAAYYVKHGKYPERALESV